MVFVETICRTDGQRLTVLVTTEPTAKRGVSAR
jgi:hypothetical protein